MNLSSRALRLNKKPEVGQSVLYVMSRDQRIDDNHALLYAQERATELKHGLMVAFFVDFNRGHRSKEHYDFMLSGLRQLEERFSQCNIPFIIKPLSNSDAIVDFCRQNMVSHVVFDFSPLAQPRKKQKIIAATVDCAVSVVDTHNIIPCWLSSDKEEFAAHTFRPKIHKLLEKWLVEPNKVIKQDVKIESAKNDWSLISSQMDKVVKSGIEVGFASGEMAAREALKEFLSRRIDKYASFRNDPNCEAQSGLSPYLHFGQISSLRVALEVIKISKCQPQILNSTKMPNLDGKTSVQASVDALLEEMIVRKELADNFCFYTKDYKSINSARSWAIETLNTHAGDKREYLYSYEEFELAKTHDPAWNAAQNQLIKSGKIHGYMRMYWAKKILEWSTDPQSAVDTAVYLNDKYSLDGGDPNGYVGILWSIAGVHDRPWFERPIFGKIRYMNYSGLNRKFDVEKYQSYWLN